MLLVLALLLAQAPPRTPDPARAGVHELVELLPSSNRAREALCRRIEEGAVLDIADWRTILIEQGHLRWRPRWPIASSFAVSVHLPMLQDWLLIELRPRCPGWKSAWGTCHDSSRYCLSFASETREDYQELGLLGPDQREVLFDLRVWYASSSASDSTRQDLEPLGTIGIDVRPVRSADQILERTVDPLWGTRLARALCVETTESGPGLGFAVEPEWPGDLGCSLDVALIHDGRTVDAGQLGLHLGRGSDWFDLRDLPQTVANGSNRSSGWSVRFKGTAKRVLRNWFAARYWAGEIEVPLAGLIRRSAPPPRAK